MIEKISKDVIVAMRSKNEFELKTLRMAKAALYNVAKTKKEPLTNLESNAVLLTMVKQRKDSIDQFTKGGREDLAAIERQEITILERYLPQAITEENLATALEMTLAKFTENNGRVASVKDMGSIMKSVQGFITDYNLRCDGKLLSEMVKNKLA